jgi:DNA recombination protein RmuC
MNGFSELLSEPVARLGATTITLGQAAVSLFVLLLLLVFGLGFALWIAAKARSAAAEEAAQRAREAEARMAEITKAQAEMQGRLGTLAEVFTSRQAELNKAIGERLDGMTSRLGHSITEQTKSTHENLAKLQDRFGAVEYPVARRAGGATPAHSLQQADARRLRPEPHGGDRRRWPAAGRL